MICSGLLATRQAQCTAPRRVKQVSVFAPRRTRAPRMVASDAALPIDIYVISTIASNVDLGASSYGPSKLLMDSPEVIVSTTLLLALGVFAAIRASASVFEDKEDAKRIIEAKKRHKKFKASGVSKAAAAFVDGERLLAEKQPATGAKPAKNSVLTAHADSSKRERAPTSAGAAAPLQPEGRAAHDAEPAAKDSARRNGAAAPAAASASAGPARSATAGATPAKVAAMAVTASKPAHERPVPVASAALSTADAPARPQLRAEPVLPAVKSQDAAASSPRGDEAVGTSRNVTEPAAAAAGGLEPDASQDAGAETHRSTHPLRALWHAIVASFARLWRYLRSLFGGSSSHPTSRTA